jgi:hypothetical protein
MVEPRDGDRLGAEPATRRGIVQIGIQDLDGDLTFGLLSVAETPALAAFDPGGTVPTIVWPTTSVRPRGPLERWSSRRPILSRSPCSSGRDRIRHPGAT